MGIVNNALAKSASHRVLSVEEYNDFDPNIAYASGIRKVVFSSPVNLSSPTQGDLLGMRLIRNLTALGIRANWELAGIPKDLEWESISHLPPPATIPEAMESDQFRSWQEGFYLGRCFWRKGPGFLEIRDRRRGTLVRYTITEANFCAAIEELEKGGNDIPVDVLETLVEERLVLVLGSFPWLAPYRLSRWPTPSMVV